MGLLDIFGEQIPVILLKPDYSIQTLKLNIDNFATNAITQKKNGDRYKTWMLMHQLMKPCYGVPGIKDGTRALMVSSTDVIFDPLDQLDGTWHDKKKFREHLTEFAREQQHKADMGRSDKMQTSTLLLSASVLIFIIFLVLMGVKAYYGG